LDYLIKQEIENVILAVGFKYEPIKAFFGDQYRSLHIDYSIEDEPLGTGGAIQEAIQHSNSEEVFVLNGDTLFEIDLKILGDHFRSADATLAIALKHLENFDRYGTVEINPSNQIVNIKEKQPVSSGFINGGIYLLNKKLFDREFPSVFSFERELMEKYHEQDKFYGIPFDDYFIDVGIPRDYERAQHEFKRFED